MLTGFQVLSHVQWKAELEFKPWPLTLDPKHLSSGLQDGFWHWITHNAVLNLSTAAWLHNMPTSGLRHLHKEQSIHLQQEFKISIFSQVLLKKTQNNLFRHTLDWWGNFSSDKGILAFVCHLSVYFLQIIKFPKWSLNKELKTSHPWQTYPISQVAKATEPKTC